ncbi:hypothetical protein B0H11DRAFT_556553 [Mycena galericulata]|nr:hypothetical protein B0H11DRAFT_556553 [Mycena galericulata]
MPQIRLDAACLLGCVLESLGFGLFSMMAGFTLRMILVAERAAKRPIVLVPVLGFLWILSAMHWVVNVYRVYQAFIVFPDGAVAFYNTLGHPSYTAKNVAYATLTLVADGFASYRCYIVWNRKWYIGAIPGFLLLSTAVAGYGTTYVFTTVHPGNVIFLTSIVPWITAWTTLTLSTNVICTCLIGFRIVRSKIALRNTSRVGRDRLSSTLIIIVESAAIYSATLVALITSYLCGNNGQYVVIDMTVSVIGLTFTMIILRVSLGVSSSGETYTTTRGLNSELTRLPVAQGEVSVNVTRLVEVNRDDYGFSSKNTSNHGGKERFDV